jgi:hypothetical protein
LALNKVQVQQGSINHIITELHKTIQAQQQKVSNPKADCNGKTTAEIMD